MNVLIDILSQVRGMFSFKSICITKYAYLILFVALIHTLTAHNQPNGLDYPIGLAFAESDAKAYLMAVDKCAYLKEMK